MMMEVNGGFFFKKKTPQRLLIFFLIIKDSEPRTPGRAVFRKNIVEVHQLHNQELNLLLVMMSFLNVLYAHYHITFRIFKVSINIEWIL